MGKVIGFVCLVGAGLKPAPTFAPPVSFGHSPRDRGTIAPSEPGHPPLASLCSLAPPSRSERGECLFVPGFASEGYGCRVYSGG